jgi:ABC-type branched-subunit amino acid transport system ATPase component
VLALKARYGLTVVLVEHVLKLVMASCDTVTVLDHGEKIAEGPPAMIRDDHRLSRQRNARRRSACLFKSVMTFARLDRV